jgi:hypothetical protein
MSRPLIVSDELYARLEAEARGRGLQTVEQLLEQLQVPENNLKSREEVVQEIDALRGRLYAEHGEMPDSIELLREDQAR